MERVYIVRIPSPYNSDEYLTNDELFDEVERRFQHACHKISLSKSGGSAVIHFTSDVKMERAFAMYDDIEVVD